MTFQRLSGRISLPFAILVLGGSVVLMIVMAWSLAKDDRERFERLARTNAEFMDRVKLPPSPRMADELRQVLGFDVFFRKDHVLVPEPVWLVSMDSVPGVAADGKCHVHGTLETVAVPLESGHDLVLVRPGFAFRNLHWASSVLPVLIAFWLLSLLVAWLVSRSLVRPLRHLASKLPEIEKPGGLDLPESARNDEIGDVARAFVRTREALQAERSERERAEKLAVLGRMTAALAHEIQNPVSAIKMHAQLWQGDGADSTAQVIEHEAARIEGLVNQWMFLSKPQPPAISDVDVSTLLSQVVKAHQAQLDHAQVKLELQADASARAQGDAKRLAQVFSNLLVNAIQAMPLGGSLTIVCMSEEQQVIVTFTDTGKGFSNEALARFSDFFFSEKEGGMGIGLSVANEIVKAHRGELRVANRPEGGAIVTVSLPAGDISLKTSGSHA
jgi:signal transduction histidine kinase